MRNFLGFGEEKDRRHLERNIFGHNLKLREETQKKNVENYIIKTSVICTHATPSG
jgi:hypothetical protein